MSEYTGNIPKWQEDIMALCTQISEIMHKNCHPHTTVIVEHTFARIVSDDLGCPTVPYPDNDLLCVDESIDLLNEN